MATVATNATSVPLATPNNMIETSVTPNPTESGDANASAHFFDFFSLPRELRDMILGQPNLFDKQLCRLPTGETLKVTVRKLSTSMLLVNHEFARECRENAQNEVTIMVEDHDTLSNLKSPMPSMKASCVAALEARLVLLDTEEIDQHLSWIANWTAEATELRSVKIDFYMDDWHADCTNFKNSEPAKAISDAIKSSKKLQRIRLFAR